MTPENEVGAKSGHWKWKNKYRMGNEEESSFSRGKLFVNREGNAYKRRK